LKFVLSFNRSPAARRRRPKQAKNNDVGQETFVYRNLADVTRKQRAIDRLYQRRTLSRVHLIDNAPGARDPMTSHSPSGMRTSFSNSPTVVTNIGEHRVSGTVSVKNISRTNIEKPNEIKSMQMKPLNNGNRNGNTSANPRSAVNFVRVNRVSNMDDTDTTNLNTIRQKNSISTISKKMTQFNVTTLP
jgi:hypothetical protein